MPKNSEPLATPERYSKRAIEFAGKRSFTRKRISSPGSLQCRGPVALSVTLLLADVPDGFVKGGVHLFARNTLRGGVRPTVPSDFRRPGERLVPRLVALFRADVDDPDHDLLIRVQMLADDVLQRSQLVRVNVIHVLDEALHTATIRSKTVYRESQDFESAERHGSGLPRMTFR